MKTLIALALAASATFAGSAPANAAQGCGPGGHRGLYGHCRTDVGPRRGAGLALVTGNYYHGRGYWDGRRYRQNRYRDHNGWRYR